MKYKNRKVLLSLAALVAAGLLGAAAGFGVRANREEPATVPLDHFVQFEAPMLYGWDTATDSR